MSLIIFDLFSFGWQWYVEEKKPTEYYASDSIVEFLKKDSDYFRVVNDDILSPNAGSAYYICTTSGSNPLSLKEYEDISRREDLLNVKYVLSKKYLDADKYKLVFSDGERKIFERKVFTPRAFVPAQVVTGAEGADTIGSEEFDPQKVSIIEDDVDMALLAELKGRNSGEVKIISYEPNKISLEAILEKPGFVVLSEIYYPGWTAYIDGKPDQVYRANRLLRAVFVPQGRHQIVMVFDPFSYRLGLRFTMITWLIIGAVLLVKMGIYLKSIIISPRPS